MTKTTKTIFITKLWEIKIFYQITTIQKNTLFSFKMLNNAAKSDKIHSYKVWNCALLKYFVYFPLVTLFTCFKAAVSAVGWESEQFKLPLGHQISHLSGGSATHPLAFLISSDLKWETNIVFLATTRWLRNKHTRIKMWNFISSNFKENEIQRLSCAASDLFWFVNLLFFWGFYFISFSQALKFVFLWKKKTFNSTWIF